MIKIEENTTIKFSGKGKLMGIDETGITLLDMKESTLDKISFDQIKELIGKEITIAIQNKEEV